MLSKILVKKEPVFIGDPKYSCWGPGEVETDLSVDRLVDRPTVRFLTIGAVG